MERLPQAGTFKWKKGDAVAIAAVALLAAGIIAGFAIYGNVSKTVTAEIYQNGEKIREVSLSEDQSFEIEGAYHNTVTVKDGRISVSETDCPGSDCAHSGWKSRAGESIVCLPNKVEIRLRANVEGEDQVDFVTGY